MSDRLFPVSEEPTSDWNAPDSKSPGHVNGTTGNEASCKPIGPTSPTTPMCGTLRTWSLGSHAGSNGEATNSSHASGGPVGLGIQEEIAPSLRAGRTMSIASTSATSPTQCPACGEPLEPMAFTYKVTTGADPKPPTLTTHSPSLMGQTGETGNMLPRVVMECRTCALTSSAEGSPARTSALPESDADSTGNEACLPLNSSGSPSLFDPAGYSWRTYRDSCQATVDGTWRGSSTSWGPLAMGGVTGFSMLSISQFRNGGGESSLSPVQPTLSMILEPQPDSRYALSGKAAAGILRRAGRRGRSLPPALEAALRQVAASAD